MLSTVFMFASCLLASCLAQRPFYAGNRPIGYPSLDLNTPAQSNIGDRFSNDESPSASTSTTTQRLPIEALGDQALFDRLNKLPEDKQPFWLLNWKALEAQRKNPQNYPQRPSFFNPNSVGK